jgi:hypothetical protein
MACRCLGHDPGHGERNADANAQSLSIINDFEPSASAIAFGRHGVAGSVIKATTTYCWESPRTSKATPAPRIAARTFQATGSGGAWG